MQDEILGQMNEASKNGLAFFQELSTINGNAIKSLFELQFETVSESVTEGTEKMKALTSTQDYKEFFGASAEMMNEYSEKFMDYSKKAEGIITKTNDEIISTYEKSFTVEAPKAKTPAKKAPAKKAAAKKAA